MTGLGIQQELNLWRYKKMSTTIKNKKLEEEIAQYTENCLPIFNLLDMKYINLNESFFTPNGENWLVDGKTYFKFDKDKIPREILEIVYDEISENYWGFEFENTPKDNDEFYIMYDTTDKLAEGMEDKTKGGITYFAVKRNGEIFVECEAIGGLLMFMKSLNHPKLEEIKAKVSVFANECYNWIVNTENTIQVS